jgi:hypothetical protein
MTRGKGGFFIDTPWSPSTAPWSLDQTYWGLRLADITHQPVALDRDLVRRWLEPAFTGQLDRSALPAVMQMMMSVHIASRLGISLEFSDADLALEKYRRPDGYLADGEAERTDPSSDTYALQAHRELGVPAPRSVVAAVVERVLGETGPLTATRAYNAVPELQAYANLDSRDQTLPRTQIERLARAIRTRLDRTRPGLIPFAVLGSLSVTAKTLGVVLPPPGARWCDLVRSASTDRDNGIQTLVHAHELGCPRVPQVAVAAPSRSGWPEGAFDDHDGSLLESTRAALALLLPSDRARYQRPVRAWLESTWTKSEPTGFFDAYALAMLRQEVGLPAFFNLSPPPKHQVSPQRSIIAALSAQALSRPGDHPPTVLAGLRRYGTAAGSMALPRRSLLEALAMKSISAVAPQGDLTKAASETAARLRRRSGDFQLTPGDQEVAVLTNAIGAWLTGSRITEATLERQGTCLGDLCATYGTVEDGEASVSATALWQWCRQPGCGGHFPLFLL